MPPELEKRTSLSPAHDLIIQAEQVLSAAAWPRLEEISRCTFERVLEAFTRNKVGEEHFYSVTGYGHNDLGRKTTDAVFAHALQAEAAMVRPHFVSGTHALAVALNGCLRPGDTMLSVTGRPYDTMEEVIGLRGGGSRSLKGKGIQYQELSVFQEDGTPSYRLNSSEEKLIKEATLVFIQRSRGYSLRPSLLVEEIRELVAQVRTLNPDAIVMVDNCYGEFTEADEPTGVGADLIAGSLIKNPGGGIVPAGGYVAGKQTLVEACAEELTCPGVGLEGGYTFDLTRLILQGLFLAPGVVNEALKGMTLAAWLFSEKGYETLPQWDAHRSDIIQVIHLGSAERLVGFCQTLQKVSPINSHVVPVPAQLPGYGDEVVMAGGTFIEGSTIELSADGPLRPPYTVFLQGGVNYTHTRYAMYSILERFEPQCKLT